MPNTTPHAVDKSEFKRRLNSLIRRHDWTQTELARRAGVGRDTISTYCRGRSVPTQATLEKIAEALGVEPQVLMPNQKTEDALPAFEIRQAKGSPEQVWVAVNRHMTLSQALAIGKILEDNDDYLAGEALAEEARRQVREEQGELTLPGEE